RPGAEGEDGRSDMWMREVREFGGAPNAGLDFVEDEQKATLLGQSTQINQELVCGGNHAGLSLDRLEHHRGGLWRNEPFHGHQIVEGSLGESRYFRLE